MTGLVRSKVGEFDLNNTFNIDNIVEDVQSAILPINEVLSYESLTLNDIDKFKLLNGQKISILKPNGIYSINDELDTIALVDIKENMAKMSLFLG